MSISVKITAEVRVYHELLISWVGKVHFHGYVRGTWLLSAPFTRPIMSKLCFSCQLIAENAAMADILQKEFGS